MKGALLHFHTAGTGMICVIYEVYVMVWFKPPTPEVVWVTAHTEDMHRLNFQCVYVT